ncbi:MAG: hypothetical protein QXK38_05295 [Candidatus Caldarchaeum sp.]
MNSVKEKLRPLAEEKDIRRIQARWDELKLKVDETVLKEVYELIKEDPFSYLFLTSVILKNIESFSPNVALILMAILQKYGGDLTFGLLVDSLIELGKTKPEESKQIVDHLLRIGSALCDVAAGSLLTGLYLSQKHKILLDYMRSKHPLAQRATLRAIIYATLRRERPVAVKEQMLEILKMEHADPVVVALLPTALLCISNNEDTEIIEKAATIVKENDDAKAFILTCIYHIRHLSPTITINILKACIESNDT